MKFGSVCSGIEAASVAWHPLGWQAAFYSEIDKFPSAVLNHHYPDVPLHGDFTTIQASDYDPIDLLVGGTPCQAFSVAGLRKGFSDERGNLTLEFVRLAQRLRPRWLVWENVPGVLSIDRGRAFGSFLGGLAECGYGFAYRILDAQYFGVPQRRRRVFVVGYLGDWRPAAQILFESESLCGDITPRRSAREEVAGTFKARARSGGWGQDVDLAAGGYMRVSSYTPSSIGGYSEGVGTLRSSGGDIGGGSENLIAGNLWPAEVASTLNSHYGSKMGLENQHINEGAPLFVPVMPIALAGNTIDRQPHNGGNGTGYDDTGATYTLTKMDRHAVVFPINTQMGLRGETSNSSREGIGLGSEDDPAFTLQSAHGHAVAFAFDSTSSNSMKSNNPHSGCHVTDVAKCLDTTNPNPSKNQGGIAIAQPVAFAQNQIGELREGEVFNTLNTNSNASGRNTPLVRQTMQVRRLTPIECERLQGFPDDYTRINDKTADGSRYKALGNSMAVPVMRWIGERVDAVDASMRDNRSGVIGSRRRKQ